MVESSGTLRDWDLREPGIQAYAQVSRLAVVSLALGVLGCLALPIPVALLCGILAIRRIRASKGAVVGLPIAVAGIVLAAVMAAAWGGWLWYRADVRSRGIEQSRQVVADFFGYVARGFHDDAFALCGPELKQSLRPEALKQMEATLKWLGQVHAVEVTSTIWKRSGDVSDVAECRYRVRTERRDLEFTIVTVPCDAAGDPVSLQLSFRRLWLRLRGRDDLHWRIDRFQQEGAARPPSEEPTM